MSRIPVALGLAVVSVGCLARGSAAYEFRTRWVERVGNMDVVIVTPIVDVSTGAPRRFRLQIGAFDDASGPAPAGGILGWNVGSLVVSGPESNSDDRRTPGRLAPFNFGPLIEEIWPPPGSPDDPFTSITHIDATLGNQQPMWLCTPEGEPLPMPQPVIRGRNMFLSLYEITTDPNPGAVDYSITAAGNLLAAAEWRTVGTPTPPDCGDPRVPEDDMPGVLIYAPFPDPPQAFTSTISFVVVPGPGSVLLIVAPLLVRRRARAR